MRKVSLSLLCVSLALAGLVQSRDAPAQQTGATEVICNKQFVLSGSPAVSIIQFVAGQSGVPISVCGWFFTSGAATSTAQISAGTGTNCNANQVFVSPAVVLAPNQSVGLTPGRAFYSTPAGYMLCYNIVGTGPTGIVVWYFQ